MTATETKHRRGTSSQVAAMTPAQGEIVMDTTNDRIHIGNGSLAGGQIIPNAKDMLNETFVTATVGGTANAITLTVTPALAAYANGVRIRFKATNTNTGATTVNVNSLGTRTVQKLSGTSLVALSGSEIVAGAWYELNDDGTVFQLGSGGGGGGGLTISRTVFTSSGTWTKPAGLLYAEVELVGGGGCANSARCGAAGGYSKKLITASSLGSTETVTIGAAGTSGNSGGNTSFGSHCSGNGGVGASISVTPTGGTATGGDINITGQDGHSGTSTGILSAASYLGLGVLNGQNAKGFGSSGGLGTSSTSSSGVVIVTEYRS